MPNKKYVKITKDDHTGEVLESAVPTWEANGWTVVDDGDSESDTQQQVIEPKVAQPPAPAQQPRPEKQQP